MDIILPPLSSLIFFPFTFKIVSKIEIIFYPWKVRINTSVIILTNTKDSNPFCYLSRNSRNKTPRTHYHLKYGQKANMNIFLLSSIIK